MSFMNELLVCGFVQLYPIQLIMIQKKTLKFLPIHVWRVDILPFELIIFLIGF